MGRKPVQRFDVRLPPFVFELALNPLYLRLPSGQPLGSPLRNPRTYWISHAAALDRRVRKPDPSGSQKRAPSTTRRRARSFRQRTVEFFRRARAELRGLERATVSPNAVAAAIVGVAWEWRGTPRDETDLLLLRERTGTWKRRLRYLEDAAARLRLLRPVGRLIDELRREALNAAASSFRGEDDLLRELGIAVLDPETAHALRSFATGALAGRLERTALEVDAVCRELKALYPHLLQKSGNVAEQRTNQLFAFLAALLEPEASAPPGRETCRRLATILNAADLQGPRYFNVDNVRARLRGLWGTHLMVDSQQRVVSALLSVGLFDDGAGLPVASTVPRTRRSP